MPNSNLDRKMAGDRLRALGFDLDGAVNFKYIVLHHSASKDGAITYQWPAIRTYHMSFRYLGVIIDESRYNQLRAEGHTAGLERPWSDCGYHAGIESVGGIYQVSVGRPLTRTGAHVAGFNQQSIGICHVGNFDGDDPPAGVFDASIPFVLDLMRWFTVPTKNVIGHRECYPLLGQPVKKSCPGIRWDISLYRGFVNNILRAQVS